MKIYKNYLQFLDMAAITKMRSATSGQNLKGEVYFRLIPTTIKFTSPNPNNISNRCLIYFQKGMQILGKTTIFQIPNGVGQYSFDQIENRIDFQIASQKNLNYTVSLYEIDQQFFQERKAAQSFSIKQYYQNYEKQNNKNGYNITVRIKQNVQLQLKLFLQNTSMILEYVNSLIPQNLQQDGKSTSGKKQILSTIINRDKPRQSITKQRLFTSEIEPKAKRQVRKIQFENQQRRDSTLKSEITEGDENKQVKNQASVSKENQDQVTPSINRNESRNSSGQAIKKNVDKILQQKQNNVKPYSNFIEKLTSFEPIVEQKQTEKNIQQQIKYETIGKQQNEPRPFSKTPSQFIAQTTKQAQDQVNVQQITVDNLPIQQKAQNKSQIKTQTVTQYPLQSSKKTKITIKKAIVAFLLVLLVTGIAGALLWGNQIQEQKQDQDAKPKGKKKPKKVNKIKI